MYCKFLDEVDPADIATVGGKAVGLAKLIKAHLPVPSGFVVTTEIYRKLNAQGPLPDEFINELHRAYNDLGASKVAVRSSATSEDGAEASWAGMFETFLGVTEEDVVGRMRDCWASAKSERIKAYAATSQAVAVVVQHMVQSDYAGAAFTANPVTKDEDVMVIEAVRGLGEALVQGSVTPDTYLFDKAHHKFLEPDLADSGQPILSSAQQTQVANLAIKAEQSLGMPLDLEWALEGTKLYLLQARPITTLGS